MDITSSEELINLQISGHDWVKVLNCENKIISTFDCLDVNDHYFYYNVIIIHVPFNPFNAIIPLWGTFCFFNIKSCLDTEGSWYYGSPQINQSESESA